MGKKLGSVVILLTIFGFVAADVYVEELHLMPRPQTARRILESLGYRQVRITGVHPFSCSDDDVFRTGFAALSMAAKPVKGTVCQGWFKGATIRLD